MRPVGIPYPKLCTKFEVSSSNSFEDILDHLPENLGSRDLTEVTPILGKIIRAPVRIPQVQFSSVQYTFV